MLIIWGVPYASGSLYDFLRGEFYGNLPSLGEIIPHWLATLWWILGVLLFLIVTFEGAYRIVHQRQKKFDGKLLLLENEIEQLTINNPRILEARKRHDEDLLKLIKEWKDQLVPEYVEVDPIVRTG